MIILTLATAIGLSAIAGYYSVVGLASIFPGAFWSIIALGGTLEVSKLVTISWLYRNWKTSPYTLKHSLIIATFFLMLITSMGIFGFLSKAHIDATADLGISVVELRNLTTQEKIAKERLEYLLARANDPATASSRLDRQIQDTQKTLTTLATRKLPLLKEETKLTVEVGPIKYVAALIYGEQEGGIEKAVRLVIMLIMVVFDPLAVLLLIAANVSIKERQTKNITLYGSNTATTNSSIQIDKDNLTIMPNRSAPTIPRTKYDYTDELTFREREGNI